MQSELVLALSVLIPMTLWMAAKYALEMRQVSLQRAIAEQGCLCQGRVVAIQRPFLLDNCTRLYFDFSPDGHNTTVRACHIDRRMPGEPRAALPAQGTLVTVSYLPNHPRRAVIGKLVS